MHTYEIILISVKFPLENKVKLCSFKKNSTIKILIFFSFFFLFLSLKMSFKRCLIISKLFCDMWTDVSCNKTQLNKCSVASVPNSFRTAATYSGLETSFLSWRNTGCTRGTPMDMVGIKSTTNKLGMESVRTDLEGRSHQILPAVMPKWISPCSVLLGTPRFPCKVSP